ncbi:hypothetical protein G7Y89_g10906 [Cudoniella acicularis]|uniref:Ubiquitin-like domain-containing protein n=1 Tax=Cudoniella acicularis TaxID=354080 RepID=A0A8H4VYJ7_9HELO|nr:hypothetical protein G7Y89_g10906 [Cudoniella acicularis]
MYAEYQRNHPPNFQPLDMVAFHKTVLVVPATPPGPTQPGPSTQQAQPPQTGLALIPSPFTIFVKTLTGRTATISVTLSDTIDNVKHKFAKRLNLPPKEQRLIYGSRQLEDSYTLRDYSI